MPEQRSEPPTIASEIGTRPIQHSAAISPGAVIAGEYAIEELIGAGGMGAVYRAKETGDRDVAIKLILPELATTPRAREMFIEESESAKRLEHPNIVPVYRVGHDNGQLFIVMRLVRGPSLRQEIESVGALAPARATEIIADVATALTAAHERELLHRDVKPANILLGDEAAYLSDFGLTTPFRKTSGAGKSNHWAGTTQYASPEAIRGEQLDARADIYSLGCVLFEAVTGARPFEGDSEEELREAHLNADIPDVATHAPDAPAALAPLIERALAKDPAERFSTASEMAEDLRSLKRDLLLVHNARESRRARQLAELLQQSGVDAGTFEATPENRDHLNRELRSVSACGVLIGDGSLDGWSRPALQSIVHRIARDRGFRVLNLLLPGGPAPNHSSLSFLRNWRWVDLRDQWPPAEPGLREVRQQAGIALRPTDPSREPESDICPYPGLEGFDEDFAEYFVGRERETATVVDHLTENRFAAIVGASGSGKSSLLKAGVIPALRTTSDEWKIFWTRPGSDPVAAIRSALNAPNLTPGPDLGEELTSALESATAAAGRSLLVVDQFEELFTLNSDAAARETLIHALLDAGTVPDSSTSILIGMRADFYPRCAEHPRLASMLESHQLLLGPMTPDRLLRAIHEPAARVGLEFEPGLPRTIVEDAGGNPGVLPLVSHTLRRLWSERQAGLLSLSAYRRVGGVQGSLALAADALLESLPTDEHRQHARRILLRLTQPGDGTEDTRQRTEIDELVSPTDPRGAEVLNILAERRLVVLGRDRSQHQSVVDIAHEALIRGWPTLRQWISDDRERLTQAAHLSRAARDWAMNDELPDTLYRGHRLSYWIAVDKSDLSDREHRFLAASFDARRRELSTKRRRTRQTLGALATSTLILTVGVAGMFTLWQQSERATAASESQRLLNLGEAALDDLDPRKALTLALDADRESSNSGTRHLLRRAVHAFHVRRGVDVFSGGVAPSEEVWLALHEGFATVLTERGSWVADLADLTHHRVDGPDGPNLEGGLINEADAEGLLSFSTSGQLLRYSPHDFGSPPTSELSLPFGAAEPITLRASRSRRWVAVQTGDGTVFRIDRSNSRIGVVARWPQRTRAFSISDSGGVYSVDDAKGLTFEPLTDRGLRRVQKGPTKISPESSTASTGPYASFVSEVGGQYHFYWHDQRRVWRWDGRGQPSVCFEASSRITAIALGSESRFAAIAMDQNGGSAVKVIPLRPPCIRVGPGAVQLDGLPQSIAAMAFDTEGRIVTLGRAGALRVSEWRSRLATIAPVNHVALHGVGDSPQGFSLDDAGGGRAEWVEESGLGALKHSRSTQPHPREPAGFSHSVIRGQSGRVIAVARASWQDSDLTDVLLSSPNGDLSSPDGLQGRRASFVVPGPGDTIVLLTDRGFEIWSASGRRLASRRNQLIDNIGVPEAVAASPNRGLLAIGAQSRVEIIHLDSPDRPGVPACGNEEFPGPVKSLSFSRTDQELVVGASGRLYICNLAAKNRSAPVVLSRNRDDGMVARVFSNPDLLIGAGSGNVRVWTLPELMPLFSAAGPQEPVDLQLATSGLIVATGGVTGESRAPPLRFVLSELVPPSFPASLAQRGRRTSRRWRIAAALVVSSATEGKRIFGELS